MREPPPITTAQLLHRAAAVLRRHLERHVLQPADLGWSEYEVLDLLFRQPGQPLKQVADTLGIRSPTLTEVVNRLAFKNLVVRVHDLADRRMTFLHLTGYGRAVTAGLADDVATAEQELLTAHGVDPAGLVPALQRIQPGARPKE